MLFGEHAVLRGYPAIALAVDRRIRVRLERLPADEVRIASELAPWHGSWERLPMEAPFQFLGPILRDWRTRGGRAGIAVGIDAGFSSTVGLGSSAALVVSLVAGLAALDGEAPDPATIWRRSRDWIRTVQGAGSGADAAASVLGGLAWLDPAGESVESLPGTPRFSLVYSGGKRPTPEVIRLVDAWADAHPRAAEACFREMAAVTTAARDALRAGDWHQVGDLMNRHHQHQETLGVVSPPLDRIVRALRAVPGMAGAKVSGSGLGDCAIGLGVEQARIPGFETLAVHAGSRGVDHETD